MPRLHSSVLAAFRPVLKQSRIRSALGVGGGGGRKIGVFEGIPFLGLDALASAAYGPEAALTLLIPLGLLGIDYALPIFAVILGILGILYLSYTQTINAYPNGGGSYIVARENLGRMPSLLAGAALILDYMLDVAVGISAGVGALVSVFPHLHGHMLSLGLWILLLVTVVNLRGVRSSGLVFALPTYLFVFTLLVTLGYGNWLVATSGSAPHPLVRLPELPPGHSQGWNLALGWLVLRSFASGCTAMTGVEAISNGVPNFSAPGQKKAKQTLTAVVAVLGVLLAGIVYLCRAYKIGAVDPDSSHYQSIISQVVGAVWGRNWIYFTTLFSTIAVLALSANTGFADFPRLCRLLAQDDYMPRAFTGRGRRLVFSTGIVVLSLLTAILLVAFHGVTDNLIPLFAVGAFLAFTLSQFGMVVHWKTHPSKHSRFSLAANMLGGICTALALAIIVVAKFTAGAWVSVVLIAAMVYLFVRIERHYKKVAVALATDQPIDLSDLRKPLVVVPIRDWNVVGCMGLTYALRISDDVVCVHVMQDEEMTCHLETGWHRLIEVPCLEKGIPVPKLVVLPSPFRRLQSPLFQFIKDLKVEHPDRTISVIVPELQEGRWYNHLLHNQRAAALKAALLFYGDRQVNVINVPWYLDGGSRTKT